MERVNELMAAVKKCAGEERSVILKTCKKNNGTEMTGLIIKDRESNFFPIVYVDWAIKAIENGSANVDDMAKEIFRLYEESQNRELGFRKSDLIDREYILSHVELSMINEQLNAEKLEKIPHLKMIDLAVTYRIMIDSNGTASMLLTNDLIERAEIDADELKQAAFENTIKGGFRVKTMYETMIEMTEHPELVCFPEYAAPQLYVLTNMRRMYGANILLFDSELAALSEKIGEDYYIIPSSVHEVIAVPVSQAEPEALKEMINEVNRTEVASEDILSYRVYRYNRTERKVTIAV